MEWKEVIGFPLYEVSSTGEVRNKETGHIKIKSKSSSGYYQVSIYKKEDGNVKSYVHKLVAEAFISVAEGKTVDHIDGNKLNNNVSNLRWLTQSENNLVRRNYTRNKSGKIGVFWRAKIGKYEAYCSLKGKWYSCGLWTTLEEAAEARAKKLKELCPSLEM